MFATTVYSINHKACVNVASRQLKTAKFDSLLSKFDVTTSEFAATVFAAKHAQRRLATIGPSHKNSQQSEEDKTPRLRGWMMNTVCGFDSWVYKSIVTYWSVTWASPLNLKCLPLKFISSYGSCLILECWPFVK